MPLTVVTTCSSRKAFTPAPELECRSLPRGGLETVGQEWLSRINSAAPVCRAADLYKGRGFGYAARATAAGDVFTISAGLGLLRPGELVPSYGLTVAAGADDDIFRKVTSRRNPAAWWGVVSQSRFSSSVRSAFEKPGLVLIALSAPYLAMISAEIQALPESDLERLRLFLPGTPRMLPASLSASLMPYDNRLNLPASPLRGPLTDFAPRAALLFAQTILPEMPTAGPDAHADAVADWLEELASRPGALRP